MLVLKKKKKRGNLHAVFVEGILHVLTVPTVIKGKGLDLLTLSSFASSLSKIIGKTMKSVL